MRNKAIKFAGTGFLLVSIVAGSVNNVNANWLDDWYNNVMTSSSGVNYFEGQKRGYATFGSFSLRLPTRTDYLFSIEKPYLRIGCGGIDLFMGSFSFLNVDYLVQKIQRMMQVAQNGLNQNETQQERTQGQQQKQGQYSQSQNKETQEQQKQEKQQGQGKEQEYEQGSQTQGQYGQK